MVFIFTIIISYIATNIDDIFLLMTWFSERNSSLKISHIIIGNYVGFTMIVLFSLIGAAGALVIPQAWIGLLGLVPIYLGGKSLLELYKKREEDYQMGPEGDVFTTGEVIDSMEIAKAPNRLQKLFNPNIYKIATITFANGGDNIGIYIPFFATYSGWQIGIIVIVFLLLNALWCYLAYNLSKFPVIAQTLERYGHIIVPFVLIGLGVLILKANGTIPYFTEKLL